MSQYSYCPYCLRPGSSGQMCGCGRDPAAYRSESHHFPAGQFLARRYYIGRVLGEGGFGITYLGLDTKLGRRVAIKEYFPRALVRRESLATLNVTCYTGSAEYFEKGREQFLHEAQTLAKMEDIPEIVRVLDFFPANNSAYIVMEYLEGWTLKELVTRQGIMPVGYIMQVMEPVLKAMDSMHSRGQLHRDISPDNLMMGKDGRIKLMDFGCAREMGGGQTMTAIVKPGYAPLENTTGHDQGPWTDVYGTCATIYYCLTGVVPPDSIRRMRSDELIPPSKLGVNISEAQEQALLKGMSVSIRDRWQSVKTLYAALYGRTFAGVPVNLPELYAVQYGAAAAAGRSDMGDVTRYVMSADHDRLQDRKKEPKKKSKAWLWLLIFPVLLLLLVLFWLLHPHVYGPWETVEAASCEEKGKEARSCFCGETEARAIQAAGHRLVTDAAVEATCTENGLTQGSRCSVCGEVDTAQQIVEAPGHTLVTDVAVAATCTAEGKTEGLHCSSCGEIITAQETIPMLEHISVQSPNVAATCWAEGTIGGVHCSACNTVLTAPQTVEKLDHTPVLDAAVAATCTEDGKTEGSHCSVCGEVIQAQEAVTKTGHTVVTDKAVAATCTKDGKTEGSHCSVCEQVLTAQKTVKATGHQYSGGKCTLCGTLAPSEGLAYKLVGDHYIVSIGQCTDSHIVIPSTYNGEPVTEIAEEGFKYSSITKVTIPSSVKTIGDSAFYNCVNLTSVTIPSGVVAIGDDAFCMCENLTSVTIPSSVRTIGDGAFSLCDNLTSATIPSGVVTIGRGAFSATSLTSVTIPSTVTTIGEYAFQMIYELTKVTMQNGIKTIGEGAFQYCSSLASVSIPSSVTKIGDYAFERCYDLENVVIPSSVSSMGERVFVQCRMDAIYCRASSQSAGWDANWNVIEDESNDSRFAVVWGYSG